jgi:glutamyl-tRNA reductase
VRAVQPTLVVIGLNHRTAPVEVRERFWMSGCRQAEALAMLSQAEGIEEVLVFSTCKRTEFVVWGDATLAINSVLRFLTAEYDLKLCEWNSFYRLLDEQALAHAFRVGCGLDAIYIGEKNIGRQVSFAWQQARNAVTSGRFLDAVLQKTLATRKRVRKETTLGSQAVSAPVAAVDLASRIFGSLAGRNIVLLGAGRMGEAAARELVGRGAESIAVVNRAEDRANKLAQLPGVHACKSDDRWAALAGADLVISATSAPGFIFTSDDMKKLAVERKGRKLVLIDLALPRNIDPVVREFDGVLLYDLEDLERALEPRAGTRDGEQQAEEIVLAEVRAFKKEFLAERGAADATDLRHRLDEICRQELESFRLEQGPFPKDQDQLITAVSNRLAHRIAGSLAQEMKVHQNARKAGRASATL